MNGVIAICKEHIPKWGSQHCALEYLVADGVFCRPLALYNHGCLSGREVRIEQLHKLVTNTSSVQLAYQQRFVHPIKRSRYIGEIDCNEFTTGEGQEPASNQQSEQIVATAAWLVSPLAETKSICRSEMCHNEAGEDTFNNL